tara:strand:+ start:8478 stop:8603 length:126 start_codon:yes stop_codon:yes gene_type:complete
MPLTRILLQSQALDRAAGKSSGKGLKELEKKNDLRFLAKRI